MNQKDVKDVAQQAGRKIQSLVQDESPIERIQEAARSADENVRQFAKAQPVLAMGIAVVAGYLVGRALARAS